MLPPVPLLRVTAEECEAHENNQAERGYASYKRDNTYTHFSRSELYGGEGRHTRLPLYPTDDPGWVSTGSP